MAELSPVIVELTADISKWVAQMHRVADAVEAAAKDPVEATCAHCGQRTRLGFYDSAGQDAERPAKNATPT